MEQRQKSMVFFQRGDEVEAAAWLDLEVEFWDEEVGVEVVEDDGRRRGYRRATNGPDILRR